MNLRKPAAKRSTLILIAGILWSAVGLFLMTLATVWLIRAELWLVMVFGLIALTAGWLYFRSMFIKLIDKNLDRIMAQAPGQEKVCVFAFQNVRSYLIALVMMAMGYGLRHSGVPKVYLSPFYFAVGFGLFVSSLAYYRYLRQL